MNFHPPAPPSPPSLSDIIDAGQQMLDGAGQAAQDAAAQLGQEASDAASEAAGCAEAAMDVLIAVGDVPDASLAAVRGAFGEAKELVAVATGATLHVVAVVIATTTVIAKGGSAAAKATVATTLRAAQGAVKVATGVATYVAARTLLETKQTVRAARGEAGDVGQAVQALLSRLDEWRQREQAEQRRAGQPGPRPVDAMLANLQQAATALAALHRTVASCAKAPSRSAAPATAAPARKAPQIASFRRVDSAVSRLLPVLQRRLAHGPKPRQAVAALHRLRARAQPRPIGRRA